ncbi:MAG: glycosyltransferase [Burkholderiaceae bacterium]
MSGQTPKPHVGAVVIGRNEGERLRRCLASLLPVVSRIVYVDSGSTDGSAAHAASLGVEVVDLDLSRPFTAARARNEGFARLTALEPDLPFVQFVDGDCEVVAGWVPAAFEYLSDNPDCAVVCGRRRERFPDRSVYNWLCDREWDTPPGDADSCGGDALMRTRPLQDIRGYRDDLIAGEEPEMCLRLRRQGWRIRRLPEEMTLHDAAMTRFGQWWTRQVRSGHAYAEGAWLHGSGPERHWVRETVRALAWGLAVPVAALLLAGAWSPWFLSLLAVYPLQFLRLGLRNRSWALAWSSVVGRFAETAGVLKFHLTRWRGGDRRIIEYK